VLHWSNFNKDLLKYSALIIVIDVQIIELKKFFELPIDESRSMDLEDLRHQHSEFSRADSRDRFFNYTDVSETESVSIVRVLLWLKTSLSKLYTRTSPGLPGRHYWECVTSSF
jgi:hypothetical protein